MTMSLLPELSTIIRQAADLIRDSAVSDISTKRKQDYVTDIDRKSDSFLTDRLATLLADVPVFSEERPVDGTAKRFWIIDPLDGTHNLIAGLPMVAVSVALCDHLGPVLGTVFDVFGQICYSAGRGSGAQKNGDRLKILDQAMDLAAVSTGLLDRMIDHPDAWRQLRHLVKIRNLGSQALQLCAVAEGRLGAALSHEARFWDDAAGGLIVREAGGIYESRVPGQDFRVMIVNQTEMKSAAVHPALYPEVRGILGLIYRT